MVGLVSRNLFSHGVCRFAGGVGSGVNGATDLVDERIGSYSGK